MHLICRLIRKVGSRLLDAQGYLCQEVSTSYPEVGCRHVSWSQSPESLAFMQQTWTEGLYVPALAKCRAGNDFFFSYKDFSRTVQFLLQWRIIDQREFSCLPGSSASHDTTVAYCPKHACSPPVLRDEHMTIPHMAGMVSCPRTEALKTWREHGAMCCPCRSR